jgi:hypothetical protein
LVTDPAIASEAIGRAAARPAARVTTGIWTWALFIVLAAGLALLACATKVNHDEDQYLAATVLAARLRPFHDFLYLQTPLQPLLTAPLAALFPGHTFAALRLFSAATGALVLAAVYAGQRGLGVREGHAALATVLMAGCLVFEFSCTVFRNDALPTLFLSLGLVASLAALRERKASALLWALSGLALGAAASAKVSFAVPLAALGVFAAARLFSAEDRRGTLFDLLGLGAGAALGLAPIAIAWAGAPEAFRYGVFDFAVRDTFDWYRLNGEAWKLGLPAKMIYSFLVLSVGTAIPALAIVAHGVWRRRREGVRQSESAVLLEVMLLAGLVAAWAPTPTYRQYFMPLLPPLFMRLGLELEPLFARLPGRWEKFAVLGTIIGLGLGLGYLAVTIDIAAFRDRWAIAQVEREAHWIGERMRAAGANGPIAALSPHAVLDSGYPLDPRFATGVFVYRTGDRLSVDQQRRLHVISPATQAEFLDEAPPAAIVLGYEPGALLHPEESLRAYAQSRGYERVKSPMGDAELYIRPAPPQH